MNPQELLFARLVCAVAFFVGACICFGAKRLKQAALFLFGFGIGLLPVGGFLSATPQGKQALRRALHFDFSLLTIEVLATMLALALVAGVVVMLWSRVLLSLFFFLLFSQASCNCEGIKEAWLNFTTWFWMLVLAALVGILLRGQRRTKTGDPVIDERGERWLDAFYGSALMVGALLTALDPTKPVLFLQLSSIQNAASHGDLAWVGAASWLAAFVLSGLFLERKAQQKHSALRKALEHTPEQPTPPGP